MAGLPLHTQQKIERLLNEIGAIFKNPRITLVVRNPDLTAQGLDGDCVITNDDLDQAIRAIEVRQYEMEVEKDKKPQQVS